MLPAWELTAQSRYILNPWYKDQLTIVSVALPEGEQAGMVASGAGTRSLSVAAAGGGWPAAGGGWPMAAGGGWPTAAGDRIPPGEEGAVL